MPAQRSGSVLALAALSAVATLGFARLFGDASWMGPVGAFPGLEGGFTLLDFPDQTTFPTEVYAESIAGDLYPESADQITRINLAFERIDELALPPGQSSDLIRRAIEELPGP